MIIYGILGWMIIGYISEALLRSMHLFLVYLKGCKHCVECYKIVKAYVYDEYNVLGIILAYILEGIIWPITIIVYLYSIRSLNEMYEDYEYTFYQKDEA